MRIALLIALVAGLVSTAYAQNMSEDVAAELREADRAFFAGDQQAAYEAAERAMALADNDEEEIRSLYLIAEITLDQERFVESEGLARAAFERLQAVSPGSVEFLERLLQIESYSALRQGNRDRWYELLQEIQLLNATELERQWLIRDDGMQHLLSGYECPQTTEFGILYEPLSFELDGRDVGCKYIFRERPDIVVTMHVYRAPGSDYDQTFQDARAPLAQVFPAARVTEDGETEMAGLPVQFAILTDTDRETGVWTSQIGDWSIKLRMTHFGNGTRADFQAAAEQTFANAAAMPEHLAACEVGRAALTATTPQTGFETAMRSAMIISAAADRGFAPPARLRCFIEGTPMGDESTTWFETDSSGRVAGLHAESTTGRGLAVRAIPSGDFIGDVDDAESTEFIGYFVNPAGAHIVGSYDGPPSAEEFLRLAASINQGEAQVISSVEIGEDGTNIVLHTDGSDLLNSSAD